MLPLRNKKAQGNLETLILIGGAVLIAVIIITIVTSLGSNSRKTATEQTDQAVASTDVPFAPNIVSVDARYADCIDSPNNALLRFSWTPISNQGTFRLIIENSSNDVVGNLDYVVSNTFETQDMNNLNPNLTTDLIVSQIDLGEGHCGDSYFLSIEASKNNQTQTSRRYPFNWNKQGTKTELINRPTLVPAPGFYNVALFPNSIQLTVPDPTNYNIYYTTDGSVPTILSNLYTYGSDIPIMSGQTISAISEVGSLISPVAIGTYTYSYYTVDSIVASPDDSINLTDPINVSLSSTTSGADIYYSLNGTTPDCSGSFFLYSSPITISSDITIKSIGCKTDYIDSSVSTNNYTFFVPLDALTITPVGGDYTSIQNVIITSTNGGAIIHYTLTGVDPTLMSPIYSGPIAISSNTTLKAKAFVGTFESPMSTEDYNVTLPATSPVFNPASGTYSVDQSVLLSSTTPVPYTIRYTTDGSDPIETSTAYTGLVSVNKNSTLKAKTFKTGWSNSPTTTAAYNFALSLPTFNPLPGVYSNAQSIQINSAAGAQIRYTLDGTNPSLTNGTLINAGEYTIPISSTSTLKATAFKNDWSASNINSGIYTINALAATPTFNPNGGAYTNSVNISLSCTTAGSSIRYTTDGSTPTLDVGTVYSGAINLITTTTINAVCYATGYSTSQIATQTFTVIPQVETPTSTMSAGTYVTEITIPLVTTTSGAIIRYSINGSEPTETTEILYSEPISLITNGTYVIRAKAFMSGYSESNLFIQTYTINIPSLTLAIISPLSNSSYDQGYNITFTANATNIIGTPTYVWEYSKDGGTWTIFGSNASSFVNNFSTIGNYNLRVTLTDSGRSGAGNSVTATLNNLHIISPLAVVFTSPANGSSFGLTSIPVTAVVTNYIGSLSGNWQYSKDGGAWTTFANTSGVTSTSFTPTLGGIYKLRVIVTDNARPVGYNIATSNEVVGIEIVGHTYIMFNGNELQLERSGKIMRYYNSAAHNYCNNLVAEGYSDWRLNTTAELTEIFNVWSAGGRNIYAFSGAPLIVNFPEDYFWGQGTCTASSYTGIDTFNFGSGSFFCIRSTYTSYASCVRDR